MEPSKDLGSSETEFLADLNELQDLQLPFPSFDLRNIALRQIEARRQIPLRYSLTLSHFAQERAKACMFRWFDDASAGRQVDYHLGTLNET